MKFKLFFTCLIIGVMMLTGCSSDSSSSEQTKPQEEEKQAIDVNEQNSPKEQENTVDEQKEAVNKESAPAEQEATNEAVASTTFEGISFNLPADAEKIEIPDQGMPVAMYLLDQTDRTNFNVLVETLPQPMSLDSYIELATANTGFEYSSNQNYSVNDIEWNEVVSLNPQQGSKLNQRTIVIDNKAYVFTYSSLPENYEKHIETFKAITDSVSINN